MDTGDEVLDPTVASAFYGRFPQLRPAQSAAIGPLLSGKSILLSSATGSGKTEAVMAPILSRLWREMVANDRLSVLYIAPTKALVNDLEKRLSPPCDTLGLRVGVRHGDRDDVRGRRLPHILLTTPESLDVLLFRNDRALMGRELPHGPGFLRAHLCPRRRDHGRRTQVRGEGSGREPSHARSVAGGEFASAEDGRV